MNESKVLLLTNLVGFFSQLIEKKYCYNKSCKYALILSGNLKHRPEMEFPIVVPRWLFESVNKLHLKAANHKVASGWILNEGGPPFVNKFLKCRTTGNLMPSQRTK